MALSHWVCQERRAVALDEVPSALDLTAGGRPRPGGSGPSWLVRGGRSGRSRYRLTAAQTDLLLRGNPTQVAPAEEREGGHRGGTDERGDGGVDGDGAEGSEGVGVQEHAAQGVAHEHGLAQVAGGLDGGGVGVGVLG